MENASHNSRRFFKDISVLTIGSVIAQIINTGSYLLFARIFDPSIFGVFGVFAAAHMVLAEIINLKYDVAVMLPKEDSRANAIAKSGLKIGIAISILVALIVYFGNCLFENWNTFYWLPLVVLSSGYIQPFTTLFNRAGNYVKISMARSIQAVTNFLVVVFCWKIGWNNINALIVGYTVGHLGHAVFLTLNSSFKLSLSNSASKSELKEYLKFPKYSTWSSMINNFSRQLPFFVLKPFFGEVLIGYYTLASKVLQSPYGLISNAMGQVFYRNASLVSDHSELRILWKKTIITTFLVGIIPAIFLAIYGEQIFSFFFGNQWVEAGRLVQILIYWVFIGFMAQPVSSLIDIHQKLRFELNYNALLFVCRLAALLLGVYVKDFVTAIVLVSIVGVVFNLFMLAYVKQLVRE